ncbi:MAG: YkgJ family cysteine cluster protein [Planctomycetia bacterium]|nr:YkgJ family cysteine cluster protein [Planctomycetia bacterium]
MESELWYKDGLRFGCRGCGICCTGEEGYVWVTAKEIRDLAKAYGISAVDYENAFVRRVGRKKSLKELPNGDCVMFDRKTKGCRLYEQRPVQCRTWPFWEDNIDLPSSWKKTAKFCRGCDNPDGTLYSLEEIRERADQKF